MEVKHCITLKKNHSNVQEHSENYAGIIPRKDYFYTQERANFPPAFTRPLG